MLRHAFEILGCVRVQFTTDVIHESSRRAILRLGAVQEGIVRNERIMPSGRKRDSVRFSIIDDEWPELRAGLERRLRVGGASIEDAPAECRAGGRGLRCSPTEGGKGGLMIDYTSTGRADVTAPANPGHSRPASSP